MADQILNAQSPGELKEIFKSEEIQKLPEFLKALYAESLVMMAVYFLLTDLLKRVEALESAQRGRDDEDV